MNGKLGLKEQAYQAMPKRDDYKQRGNMKALHFFAGLQSKHARGKEEEEEGAENERREKEKEKEREKKIKNYICHGIADFGIIFPSLNPKAVSNYRIIMKTLK